MRKIFTPVFSADFWQIFGQIFWTDFFKDIWTDIFEDFSDYSTILTKVFSAIIRKFLYAIMVSHILCIPEKYRCIPNSPWVPTVPTPLCLMMDCTFCISKKNDRNTWTLLERDIISWIEISIWNTYSCTYTRIEPVYGISFDLILDFTSKRLYEFCG